MSTVIARQITRAVVPLMVLVSLNFFLQGHNLPGGGFIAGVMTSAAFALYYIIFDFEGIKQLRGADERTIRHLVDRYSLVGSVGLLLAAATGLMMLFMGLEFMNHRQGGLHLLLFGKIHWTTAVIFDLGVYLVVVGSLMTMVEVLGEE